MGVESSRHPQFAVLSSTITVSVAAVFGTRLTVEQTVNQLHISQISLKDVLQVREVGERVVSHVFEHVEEPAPDFEAMRQAVLPPQGLEDCSNGKSERSVPKDV